MTADITATDCCPYGCGPNTVEPHPDRPGYRWCHSCETTVYPDTPADPAFDADLLAHEAALAAAHLAELAAEDARWAARMDVLDAWYAGVCDKYRDRCRICAAVIIYGELCATCAEGNDPFGVDLEAPGGWMVQAGRQTA